MKIRFSVSAFSFCLFSMGGNSELELIFGACKTQFDQFQLKIASQSQLDLEKLKIDLKGKV